MLLLLLWRLEFRTLHTNMKGRKSDQYDGISFSVYVVELETVQAGAL